MAKASPPAETMPTPRSARRVSAKAASTVRLRGTSRLLPRLDEHRHEVAGTPQAHERLGGGVERDALGDQRLDVSTARSDQRQRLAKILGVERARAEEALALADERPQVERAGLPAQGDGYQRAAGL